jgi:crossover junction endodeoxyribonuclease RuvC
MHGRGLVLGIDPGFTGGLALVGQCAIASVATMPLSMQSGRRELDAEALAAFMRSVAPRITFAAIEDVSAMPGQGVTSMFRFGYGAGMLAGMLAALDIQTLKVRPAVWKTALGLSRDKKESTRLVTKLFPTHPIIEHDGVAEAVLIAHFALTRFKGALRRSKCP